LAGTANVIKAYGALPVAIAHQTVRDTNRKFEQENNLGFAILDDTSGTAAAAFGIGWTSECLRELFEQFSADTTGFNPEVAAIVPMQARYVIGPDDIIAYADINVDYRSEPELSAVLLVPAAFAERHLIKDVADEARNHPGRASVDLSRKLEGRRHRL
jgi:peroxiredoxin